MLPSGVKFTGRTRATEGKPCQVLAAPHVVKWPPISHFCELVDPNISLKSRLRENGACERREIHGARPRRRGETPRGAELQNGLVLRTFRTEPICPSRERPARVAKATSASLGSRPSWEGGLPAEMTENPF